MIQTIEIIITPQGETTVQTQGFPGLWIESYDHDDALREIAEVCREQD